MRGSFIAVVVGKSPLYPTRDSAIRISFDFQQSFPDVLRISFFPYHICFQHLLSKNAVYQLFPVSPVCSGRHQPACGMEHLPCVRRINPVKQHGLAGTHGTDSLGGNTDMGPFREKTHQMDVNIVEFIAINRLNQLDGPIIFDMLDDFSYF